MLNLGRRSILKVVGGLALFPWHSAHLEHKANAHGHCQALKRTRMLRTQAA